MFSKSQIKLINSLDQKKFRLKHGLFLAEGKKAIFELLASSLQLHSLYTTEDIFKVDEEKTFYLEEKELKKISKLKTVQTALALFHIPVPKKIRMEGLILALDNVQDPGNLGTIIRMCDWFGIEHLVCSKGTVDCYNPKVVQATMGSIARVNLHYCSLPEFLSSAPSGFPVYGAFLEGKNIYSAKLKPEGILVMGNEANGISAEVEPYFTQKLVIPQFGKLQETESLNVATATAIFLSELRRGEFTEK